MADLNLLQLDESQNITFDADYHTPDEMACKLQRLRGLTGNTAFDILDVGGGNGRFLDTILDTFPLAHGTLLDISPHLIGVNRPHPRKSIRLGSVEKLEREFTPHSFDLITMNWLLHHLVSPTYEACSANCRLTLEVCSKLLKPRGTIVVTENMFEGFGGTNLPSWVIYRITRMSAPWFVGVSRRFFNTAGIGVCFRSANAWRKVFSDAGLRIIYDDLNAWEMPTNRKVAHVFLGVRGVAHRHFYLRPRDAVD
jgi:ubiquinone/menaquinone biosynthesis C-methylase UbiE